MRRFEALSDLELEDLDAVVGMAAREGICVQWLIKELLLELDLRGLEDLEGLEYWAES